MTTKREALMQALDGIDERLRVINTEIGIRVKQRKELDESRLKTMRMINEALQEEIEEAQKGQ